MPCQMIFYMFFHMWDYLSEQQYSYRVEIIEVSQRLPLKIDFNLIDHSHRFHLQIRH